MKTNKVRAGAVVLFTAAIFASCSLVNKSTPAANDNAIVSAIQSKLFQNPALKTQNIRVVSQNGVVVINGTVKSASDKASVEQIAKGASGVKQVIDELAVSPNSPEESSVPAPAVAQSSSPQPSPARRSLQRAAAHPSAPAPPAQQAANSQAPSPAGSGASPGAGAAAAQTAPAATGAAQSAPPQPQPVDYTIPAGTTISVRMIGTIDSSKAHPGDQFSATVASPVPVGSQTVIPTGADAQVQVVSTVNAGHYKGRPELVVELTSFTVGGNHYQVESTPVTKLGPSRTKRSAVAIGGGAGLGALLGGLIGHGKGAAIGAIVGAGAGTAGEAATKVQPAVIPPETKLDFMLKNSVTVTLSP